MRWRALGVALAVLLGVAVAGSVRSWQAERLGVLREQARAAQQVAAASQRRADRAVAEAERLRAGKDTAIRATDALRLLERVARDSAAALERAALAAAEDSAVTADSLRRVVRGLVASAEQTAAAHQDTERGWLRERATLLGIIAADSVAIADQRQAALDANLAHMRRVAELQAQIPSKAGRLLRDGLYLAAGYGLGQIAP